MADLKFHCIHCGQRVEAPLSAAGQSVPCPVCGEEIIIPGGLQNAPPPLAAATRPAPVKPNVSRKDSFCQACGTVGRPITGPVQGSLIVELLLYFFFCFPGIIYTAWRYASRQKVCCACGSTVLIPVTSPVCSGKFTISK
jgi:predicted RNA-binding Zn-ribbon protein involved in translation (DUF1610 family)